MVQSESLKSGPAWLRVGERIALDRGLHRTSGHSLEVSGVLSNVKTASLGIEDIGCIRPILELQFRKRFCGEIERFLCAKNFGNGANTILSIFTPLKFTLYGQAVQCVSHLSCIQMTQIQSWVHIWFPPAATEVIPEHRYRSKLWGTAFWYVLKSSPPKKLYLSHYENNWWCIMCICDKMWLILWMTL